MIHYGKGNGRSQSDAIKIEGAENKYEGIAAEYHIIEKLNCEVVMQKLIHENDRSYDCIVLQNEHGELLEIWFDISDFYGKL